MLRVPGTSTRTMGAISTRKDKEIAAAAAANFSASQGPTRSCPSGAETAVALQCPARAASRGPRMPRLPPGTRRDPCAARPCFGERGEVTR